MHYCVYKKIIGNLVRTLKTVNPKSEETKTAISKLLDLKQKYKEVTGTEYKNDSKVKNDGTKCKETFARKIAQQGDLVRSLKAKDAKAVRFIHLFHILSAAFSTFYMVVSVSDFQDIRNTNTELRRSGTSSQLRFIFGLMFSWKEEFEISNFPF